MPRHLCIYGVPDDLANYIATADDDDDERVHGVHGVRRISGSRRPWILKL